MRCYSPFIRAKLRVVEGDFVAERLGVIEGRIVALFVYVYSKVIMNAAENEIIARALLFILEDSSSDSSTDSSSDSKLSDSESDEDGAFSNFYAMPIVPLRNRDIPRIEAYAENVVPKMMENDIVSHFRLNRRNVEAVGNMVCAINIFRLFSLVNTCLSLCYIEFTYLNINEHLKL